MEFKTVSKHNELTHYIDGIEVDIEKFELGIIHCNINRMDYNVSLGFTNDDGSYVSVFHYN